ncbi:MAG TPA: tetratricopeptide repeat protein [Patescibacteria group bacterium]|nr:tetratricopeptide repeat protein [Patescibacteria group bacterium]
MIEMMLEAERAMAVGLLDQAERYYAQVAAADPKNSIALVGLARVALERGDQRAAYTLAGRALAVDPDNPMASHLSRRMAEIMRGRGEALPDAPGGTADGGLRDPLTGPPVERPGFVDRLLRRRR